MSIAQQIATPTAVSHARRPSAPLQVAPVPHPGSTLARIFGLIALTAIGTALMVGSVAIALIIVASNLGG